MTQREKKRFLSQEQDNYFTTPWWLKILILAIIAALIQAY